MDERTTREQARQSTFARAAQEQTNRVGYMAVDILQQNADACQQIWRSEWEFAKQMMERSADQFAQMLGITRDEGQRAAEQSSREAEAILSSGNAVARSLQHISRECTDFSRQRMQRSLDLMTKLTSCRTPQELVAVQTEFWRDNIESLAQSGRKLSDKLGELSTQITEEAARKTVEKVRRAA